MPQNGINHPAVTALAQAFAHQPLAAVINLNDNTFTEKGAVAMAKVREVQQGRRATEPGLVAVFLCTRRPMAALPRPTHSCVSCGFSHMRMSWTGQLSPGALGSGGSSVCLRTSWSGLAAAAVGADFVLRGHIEAASCLFFPQLFIEPCLVQPSKCRPQR